MTVEYQVTLMLHLYNYDNYYNQVLNVVGCLRDLANVQQTSSKCIQNTRANAGRLLPYVIIELNVCWIV